MRLHATAVPTVSREDQGQGRALQRLPQGQLPGALGGELAGERSEADGRGGQRPRAVLAGRGRQRARARHHQGDSGPSPGRGAFGDAAGAGVEGNGCAARTSAGACGELAASVGRVRHPARDPVMIQQQERITALCEQLKMACLAAEWPALAQQAARTEASFADFLEKLLDCELAAREQRKRTTLLKLATLSAVKTLEQIDWAA